jgi:xyloglucan-specific endo-beta-1,4-glucanase
MECGRYTGSNLIADISYDLWLAPSLGAANKYEIMIWIGSLGGAGPISSTGSTPLASPTIAGTKWKLFKGPNGDTTVFSFVAPTNIQNFSGDLMGFFDYLTSSQGVSTSSVVTSLQAGTEPFSGEWSACVLMVEGGRGKKVQMMLNNLLIVDIGSNAVFTTSAYTISVK